MPPQYLPVVRSLIETFTCATPEPPSVTVPQMPDGAQFPFHVPVWYEPLSTGNVWIVVGEVPSTSTSIESLDISAAGLVTPFAAVIAFEPGADGLLNVYVAESYGLVVSVFTLVPNIVGNVTSLMPEPASLALALSVNEPLPVACSHNRLLAAS